VTARDAIQARQSAVTLLQIDSDGDPGAMTVAAAGASAFALLSISYELCEIRKVLEAKP